MSKTGFKHGMGQKFMSSYFFIHAKNNPKTYQIPHKSGHMTLWQKSGFLYDVKLHPCIEVTM
jgi:hypothetical protein